MRALFCVKKEKPYLVGNKNIVNSDIKFWLSKDTLNKEFQLNGKIVAECDYEVEEIRLIETPEYAGSECNTFLYDVSTNFETKTLTEDKLCKQSCLKASELDKYLDLFKDREIYGYANHIKNLDIFDKPREMEEFSQVNNCCFEKEVDKDWDGLPIYACVFTNGCKYQSEGHTCDKHFYPIKRIHNMSKVFDERDCKWKYIISISSQEACNILNKKQDILVRKNVLKEIK